MPTTFIGAIVVTGRYSRQSGARTVAVAFTRQLATDIFLHGPRRRPRPPQARALAPRDGARLTLGRAMVAFFCETRQNVALGLSNVNEPG